MDAWLESLKIGDEVACGGRLNHFSLARVHHVTPTQIHVAGRKYRRKDGWLIGCDSWNTQYITEPTVDIRESIERRKIVYDISRAPTEKLPMDVIRAAHALLCVKP